MTLQISHKQEINLRRVLNKCEEMITTNTVIQDNFNWRFKAYLNFIDLELNNIRKDGIIDDEDRLSLYKKRIQILRNKENEVDNLLKSCNITNEMDRSITDLENKKSLQMLDDLGHISQTSQVDQVKTVVEENQMLRPEKIKPKRLQLLEKTPAYQKAIQTSILKSEQEQLSQHKQQQDNLSNALLDKAHQMKNMSLAVRDHVAGDMKLIDKIDGTVAANTQKLQNEVERLNDINKNTGFCSTIFLILVVFFTFIFMIVFIRLHSKLPDFYRRSN